MFNMKVLRCILHLLLKMIILVSGGSQNALWSLVLLPVGLLVIGLVVYIWKIKKGKTTSCTFIDNTFYSLGLWSRKTLGNISTYLFPDKQEVEAWDQLSKIQGYFYIIYYWLGGLINKIDQKLTLILFCFPLRPLVMELLQEQMNLTKLRLQTSHRMKCAATAMADIYGVFPSALLAAPVEPCGAGLRFHYQLKLTGLWAKVVVIVIVLYLCVFVFLLFVLLFYGVTSELVAPRLLIPSGLTTFPVIHQWRYIVNINILLLNSKV